ncbi:MAG: hypothetical protein Q9183_003219, partial [Haloplaca sp. 2 TL-2023]
MEPREHIYYSPSIENSSDKEQDYLIFHIPGNPGLIDFYDPFLSILQKSLSASSNANFHVYGHSLAGFGNNDKYSGVSTQLAGLGRQIEYVDDKLYDQ